MRSPINILVDILLLLDEDRKAEIPVSTPSFSSSTSGSVSIAFFRGPGSCREKFVLVPMNEWTTTKTETTKSLNNFKERSLTGRAFLAKRTFVSGNDHQSVHPFQNVNPELPRMRSRMSLQCANDFHDLCTEAHEKSPQPILCINIICQLPTKHSDTYALPFQESVPVASQTLPDRRDVRQSHYPFHSVQPQGHQLSSLLPIPQRQEMRPRQEDDRRRPRL